MAVPPGRFTGRTVVVTGAASGIGRATALPLAAQGARVVAADTSESRLHDLMGEGAGADLVGVVADVSSQRDVALIVERAGRRVDGLVNNAGIADAGLPPGEVDDETWQRVLDVNLTGAMRVTRAVLPIMLAAGSGSIVNVSSIASSRACAAGVAYTASKHALNGFTRSLAVFYRGQGIRANAVAPGRVATDLDKTLKSELARQVLLPLGLAEAPTVAAADDVATTIAFLLSDDARNVNGAVLPCDAGWSAA